MDRPQMLDRPRGLDEGSEPRLLSVVIPIFNEAENIPIAFDELNTVLDELPG